MIRVFLFMMSAVLLLSCSGKQAEVNTKVLTDTVKIRNVFGVASVEPAARLLIITPEVNGIVQSITVELDQQVKKGTVLYVLNSDIEQAQLRQAKSKLSTQERLISRAETTLEVAEKRIENATTNLERSKKLFEAQALTKKQLEDEQLNYDNAKLELEAARKEVLQQKDRLVELQADVNYFQTLAEKKVIKAPVDGRVLSIDVKVGAVVSPGTLMSEFAPDGGLIAITEIDELFASKVKIGQPASIRAQGDTVVMATGKVFLMSSYLRKKSLFSDKAEDLEDRRVLEVRVALDSSSAVLIGSRVECIINVE